MNSPCFFRFASTRSTPLPGRLTYILKTNTRRQPKDKNLFVIRLPWELVIMDIFETWMFLQYHIISIVPIPLRTNCSKPYTKLQQFGKVRVFNLFIPTSNDESTKWWSSPFDGKLRCEMGRITQCDTMDTTQALKKTPIEDNEQPHIFGSNDNDRVSDIEQDLWKGEGKEIPFTPDFVSFFSLSIYWFWNHSLEMLWCSSFSNYMCKISHPQWDPYTTWPMFLCSSYCRGG